MAGKGNRIKEPLVEQETEELEQPVVQKPVKKVKQRKRK